jgi:hypothetical protein
MRSKGLSLKTALVLALCMMGCAAKEEGPAAGAGASSGSGGTGGESGTGDPTAGTGGASGTGDPTAGTGGDSGEGGSGAGGTGGAGSGGTGGDSGAGGSVAEELDPNVNWEALTLVYAPLYSAYDGGAHTFQVPVRADGAAVELSGWQAIPSTAAKIEADPDNEGGVLITVMDAVEEITIAAHAGELGGKTTLYVTIGTPEEWEMGDARYNNGVAYELPDFTFDQLLDPNFMPPEPPDNLACNNCHTMGAKYFEIIHSPTQAAQYSDEDLINIMTMGMKPEPVCYRVLPPDLEYLYLDFHTWEAPAEEQKGLIMYLRALTPEGQGDILLPDGTYAPPGGEACLNAM